MNATTIALPHCPRPALKHKFEYGIWAARDVSRNSLQNIGGGIPVCSVRRGFVSCVGAIGPSAGTHPLILSTGSMRVYRCQGDPQIEPITCTK
jgi:hypothetical protein